MARKLRPKHKWLDGVPRDETLYWRTFGIQLYSALCEALLLCSFVQKLILSWLVMKINVIDLFKTRQENTKMECNKHEQKGITFGFNLLVLIHLKNGLQFRGRYFSAKVAHSAS